MWTRFTERARTVVFAAQTEAVTRGVFCVSTEHLLWGLVSDITNSDEPNMAVRILQSENLSRERVQFAVRERMQASGGPISPAEGGSAQLSDAAKKAIDLSFQEAQRLSDGYIGTEHFLLGILSEQEGLGGVLLREMGVTLETARNAALAQKAANGKPGVLKRLKAIVRPNSRDEANEPIVRQRPQPLAVVERSPEQIARLREVLDKGDGQAYAAILRTESYITLPPNTEIEVLDNDAPLLQMYRQVRVLSGEYAGRTFSAHAIHVDPVQSSATDNATQNAPIRGVLCIPPAPQGREPVANLPLKPVAVFDLSPEEIARFRDLSERQDIKAYTEVLRDATRAELPPNTAVEVLDNDNPALLSWRQIRVSAGEQAGKTYLVPASFIVPAETPPSARASGERITLPNAPENRPSPFEALLRAAAAAQSDAFDLTAGTPLTLKNALTEADIERLTKGILTHDQREAVERGEVVEAWCGFINETPFERVEFNVTLYRIKGRLTARFEKA